MAAQAATAGTGLHADMLTRPVLFGTLASLGLLAVFGLVVGGLSGWSALLAQVRSFWPYLLGLSVGFGVQLGLFVRLRELHRTHPGMLAASGATSTAAMISCCTHYLANVLPLIATSGLTAFVGRFQTEFFGLGLILNAWGIAILVRKLRTSTHRLCAPSPSSLPSSSHV